MLRRLAASLLDEVIGLALLHQVLRHRDRPAIAGRTGAAFPDLFCGDPARFFAPCPAAADLSRRREVRRTTHAVIEDFAFPSPVTTAFAENDLVRGRRWSVTDHESNPEADAPGSPRTARKTLLILDGLVQFGHGNERLFADVMNPAGIDVVTIDLPFNHRRTPAGHRPGQLIVGGDLDHVLSVLRQAALDVWATILGLKAEGRNVAVAGISFGGWTALAATAAVERTAPGTLASVTAIAPPIDLLRLLAEGSGIVRAARRGLNLPPSAVRELKSVARAVAPSAWPAPLPGGRVFFHAAEYDRVVPTEPIARLAADWNASLTTYPVGHMQLTSFPPWLRPVAAAVRDAAWPV